MMTSRMVRRKDM